MKRLRIVTIVGTRPEIIRLSEIIKLFDQVFEHILVHTGQNWDYTLNDIFFKDFNIRKPDYFLNSVGSDLGETIGNIISASYKLLSTLKPDGLLVLGDTNSALSVISAKRLKIPVFHMEAGNRSFDENLPEEINRRIVDHTSDVNLPYTEHARRYLLAEGIRKEYIFTTGSPLVEVFNANKEKIIQSPILDTFKLKPKQYMVVSAHREDNIDKEEHFLSLMDAINEVAITYKMPIIFSTHPRTQKKVDQYQIQFHSLVRSIKPLGYFDYNKLQQNAFCVLSDSGSVFEEASILKFSAVSIRNSIERPEAIDKGTVVIGGIEKESILSAIKLAEVIYNKNQMVVPLDYVDANTSQKVAYIIQSYIPIVNQKIWYK